MATVTALAYCRSTYDNNTRTYTLHLEDAAQYQLRASFATAEERDAWIAEQPKSHKWYSSTCDMMDGTRRYDAVADGYLTANGVNGGVNETAVRRYRAIAKRHALQWKFNANSTSNAYPTQAAFEAALA